MLPLPTGKGRKSGGIAFALSDVRPDGTRLVVGDGYGDAGVWHPFGLRAAAPYSRTREKRVRSAGGSVEAHGVFLTIVVVFAVPQLAAELGNVVGAAEPRAPDAKAGDSEGKEGVADD